MHIQAGGCYSDTEYTCETIPQLRHHLFIPITPSLSPKLVFCCHYRLIYISLKLSTNRILWYVDFWSEFLTVIAVILRYGFKVLSLGLPFCYGLVLCQLNIG